ncbi:hypothetical protein GCM10010975_02010 [Comamonas phosphati]|nr:hypothetical protein GCM10010975_02010 [Comamonas phosphati]
MPGQSDIDAATELAGARPDQQTQVFATAYHQHAIAAFEAQAVDHALKPVLAPRLAQAVQRL